MKSAAEAAGFGVAFLAAGGEELAFQRRDPVGERGGVLFRLGEFGAGGVEEIPLAAGVGLPIVCGAFQFAVNTFQLAVFAEPVRRRGQF